MSNQPELEALEQAMFDADPEVLVFGPSGAEKVSSALLERGYTIARAEPVTPSSDEVDRDLCAVSKVFPETAQDLRAHIYKLEAQVKQQQWQPIETAPKDGTYIFATDVGNHPISKEPWVGDACYWNGRSFDNDSDSLDEWDWWKPTLWMPMPPPPHKDTCVVCGHVHVGLACPTLSVISTRE